MSVDEEGGKRLMPCARAKFSFQAKNELELSFNAGVSVRLLRRIDDNWLEGELDGKVGIFPASFVEIELGIPSKARERDLANSGRPYAIGLFDFPGDCKGDLSFTKGELIELLGPVGSGWLKGRTGAQIEGIFPASFVEIMKLPVSPNGATNDHNSYGEDGDIGDVGGGGGGARSSPQSSSRGSLRARDSPRSSSRTNIISGARNSPHSLSKTELGGRNNSPRSRPRGDAAAADSPRSNSRTDLCSSNSTSRIEEGGGTHYSPEYAEPFQTPPTSRAGIGPAQSARDRGISLGDDAVFQNGFSDEDRHGEEEEDEEEEEEEVEEEVEIRPVPTPRRKSGRKSMSATMVSPERQRRGLVTTPSRTPPMSPLSPGLASPPARRQILSSSPVTSRSSPRTRRGSLTDVQRELNSLQSSLTIEKKLLVSARTLLDVTQDEGKREKLRTAITTHEENAQSIRQQISELKGERDTLTKKIEPPVRPSSPPQQSLPPPKPLSLDQQRAKVVEELVTTETDYHNQMQACCDKLIPAMEQIVEVNSDVLFGNLREVTLVSRDLAAALRQTCGGGGGEERVGEVFVRFGPRLRSAYAIYCRNHDNASSLVEKYAENVELTKKIRTALDAIRSVTLAWDLQSLLIKPVQRVLKYPLLLDKLVQTTSNSHPDYRLVHRAKEVVGQVAQDINEIKRRKDLVERYTGPGKEERRGTVSVRSFQKKVRRFQQTFTQFTGLRSKTVDPEFEELEQKLMSLETFLRQLIRNVTVWQEELQKVLDSQEVMGEGMVLYVPSDLRPLTCYQRSLVELQQSAKTHGASVTAHVLTPFQNLLSLFQDPLHLITKRRDKLLDFDHLQYALDHNTEDAEKIKQLRDACTMAKRNYEALNQQLIEELPRFIHLAQNVINHTVTVLFQLRFRFHSDTRTALRQLAQQYGPRDKERPLPSETIQLVHNESLSEVAGRLISLSIVPASLTMTLPATIRGGVPRRTSDSSGVFSDGDRDETSILSTSSEVDVDPSISEEPPSSTDSTDPPPPEQGSQLTVIYDFQAQDRAELTVTEGETVVLKCPHDRVGCSEWWLVESQSGTGYVPANFLHFYGNYNTL